jgi:hypothetical protein
VLKAAGEQDAVREGPYGSAWFAHRRDGAVNHVEVRGPAFKGSLAGGHKTLFRFSSGTQARRRLVIAEVPIDVLSLAVLEATRGDTLYVATGGGMGPGTIEALTEILSPLLTIPNALVESATDGNAAGDRYAERRAALAAEVGVAFARPGHRKA